MMTKTVTEFVSTASRSLARALDSALSRFAPLISDATVRHFLTLPHVEKLELINHFIDSNADAARLVDEGKRVSHFRERMAFTNRHHQLPCSHATQARRVHLFERLLRKDARILMLGDDDRVGPELHRSGFTKVTIIDCDELLVAELSRSVEGAEDAPVVKKFDIRIDEPASLGEFDVVCLDPPYSVDLLLLFVHFAIGRLDSTPGARLFLMTNPLNIGRAGMREVERTTAASGLALMSHLKQFNSYPMSKLNCAVLKACAFAMRRHELKGRDEGLLYFFSDCFEFVRR